MYKTHHESMQICLLSLARAQLTFAAAKSSFEYCSSHLLLIAQAFLVNQPQMKDNTWVQMITPHTILRSFLKILINQALNDLVFI